MLRRLLQIALLMLLAGCEDVVDQTEGQPGPPAGPVYPSMRGMRLPAQDPFSTAGRADKTLSAPGVRYRNGGDAYRGEPPLK